MCKTIVVNKRNAIIVTWRDLAEARTAFARFANQHGGQLDTFELGLLVQSLNEQQRIALRLLFRHQVLVTHYPEPEARPCFRFAKAWAVKPEPRRRRRAYSSPQGFASVHA